MRRKSLAEERPELLSQWDRNNTLSPFDVSCGSHKKVWWICDKGHRWPATVKNRALIGSGCPYCEHRAVLKGYNDLLTVNPKLADTWSPNNTLKPSDVSPSSNIVVRWVCENGHEWSARVADRNEGHGCPYCAGHKVWKGFNDLATTHPDLLLEWSEKNTISPESITYKHRAMVWWHCSKCGGDYQAGVYAKTQGRVCPLCIANEIFELWKENKRGLRDKTKASYVYFYDLFVRPNFGQKRIQKVKRSDVRAFYNSLIEVRGIKTSTLENIHTVLHQVFQLAVDDDIIRKNPTSMMVKEIKTAYGNDATPKKALTRDEEYLFFSEVLKRPRFRKWFPLLYIMVNTGMRVGEITGLRWCDVDLEKGFISVNHTLVYFDHRSEIRSGYTIHRPKTQAGIRMIPIMPSVKKAFLMQKEYMELAGLKSIDHIEGYDDFIFVNRYGKVHNQSTVNAAIHRMTRDINLDILDKMGENEEVLVVPYFTCHILRHTFCTKMMQLGVNIRILQEIMGHEEFSTTMDVYVNVTGQMELEEFSKFEELNRIDDVLTIVGPNDVWT